MLTAKLHKKLNSGVQCKSDDELLGEYPSLIECSKACRKKNGCNFFLATYPIAFKVQKLYYTSFLSLKMSLIPGKPDSS